MARILVVDDDAPIRNLVQTILATDGHEVFCAGDGKEAIRFLQESPFDLVITDLIMPEMEGLEMIRKVRKQRPELKIIAMTGGGYGSARDYLTWAKAFGVDQTIMKPFSRAELLEAVTGTLAGSG